MGSRGGGQGPAGPASGPPSDDNGSDSGSSSHRWRRVYVGTQVVLTAAGTVLAGANTLIGAIADKLNAAHLAIASQAVGDLLYASTTTAFTRLAAVGVGQVLKSGGVSTAPAWGAIGGTTDTSRAAIVEAFAAPAAAAVAVHAAIASDNAAAVTAGITNPVVPRSLDIVFHATWDGGDVTIVGTDQFDQAVTEVIADVAGTTVAGVKIFKTVTSINQETVGTGGAKVATVQTGAKLGLLEPMNATSAAGMAHVDGAADNAVFDATYSGVTFASAPNGAKNYVVVHNTSHAHDGTGLT